MVSLITAARGSRAGLGPRLAGALAGAVLALALLAGGAEAKVSGYSAPLDLSDADESARNPQVAVDPDGRATVVWSRNDDSGSSRVQAVRLDAAGNPGTVRTLSPPASVSSFPKVAVDPAGRATVVWTQRSSVEGSLLRTKVLRLEADGSPGTLHTRGTLASGVLAISKSRRYVAGQIRDSEDASQAAFRVDRASGAVEHVGELRGVSHLRVRVNDSGHLAATRLVDGQLEVLFSAATGVRAPLLALQHPWR
jgi:hypothetical protein